MTPLSPEMGHEPFLLPQNEARGTFATGFVVIFTTRVFMTYPFPFP